MLGGSGAQRQAGDGPAGTYRGLKAELDPSRRR